MKDDREFTEAELEEATRAMHEVAATAKFKEYQDRLSEEFGRPASVEETYDRLFCSFFEYARENIMH